MEEEKSKSGRVIRLEIPTRPLTKNAARAAQPPRLRRDAGSIRLGKRDLVGMAWTAEQGAMRLDQLALVFGAIDGRPVSNDAARKTITRWVGRGWATMRVVLQSEPPFVWLTPEGMRTAGQNLPGVEPSVATLNHNRIVTDIRVHLLSRYPRTTWRSERAIRALLSRREKGQQQPHLPDGELFGDNGAVIAIENELTAKTVERTRRIMLGLLSRRYDYDQVADAGGAKADRYRAVWYYVNSNTRNTVQRARGELPPEYQARVHVIDWPRP